MSNDRDKIAQAGIELYNKYEAEKGTHSIAEILEAKEKLEGEISAGIYTFQRKYGIRIESLHCKKVDAWLFEDGKQIEEVTLKISL